MRTVSILGDCNGCEVPLFAVGLLAERCANFHVLQFVVQIMTGDAATRKREQLRSILRGREKGKAI